MEWIRYIALALYPALYSALYPALYSALPRRTKIQGRSPAADLLSALPRRFPPGLTDPACSIKSKKWWHSADRQSEAAFKGSSVAFSNDCKRLNPNLKGLSEALSGISLVAALA